MGYKTLALVVAIIFILTHSGCASVNKNQIQTTTAYSENPVADFDTQKKKDEKEWLLIVLIVLGIGIVLGAAISASSGGNGFSLGINN
jgi:uncharacterized protein YceK